MVVVLMSMNYATYAFGEVFIICELCQRLTNKFDEINNAIDQVKWYRLPNKIQRILLTLLINVQQPVFIECFGSISCCRETFEKVSFPYTELNKYVEFIKCKMND